MLLGYNTNGLQNHRLEDALELLAKHGYQAVAVTLDTMHLDPFRTTGAQVSDWAKLFANLGLFPVIETGARYLLDPANKHEPTLMSRGSGRDRRLDFYHRAAAIGRDLGARVVSFWAGIDRQPQTDAWDWLLEGVVGACEAVRRHGLIPALEPEPGMAVATLNDYQQVVAALGTEAPDLCLDIGHLLVTGEATPKDAILGHARRLVQVHIEDMKRGVHEHLPPGQGDVNFAEVHAELQAVGYQGAVCFELSRSSHMAPDCLRLCSETWQRVAQRAN